MCIKRRTKPGSVFESDFYGAFFVRVLLRIGCKNCSEDSGKDSNESLLESRYSKRSVKSSILVHSQNKIEEDTEMSFNYRNAQKKFEKDWNRIRKEYMDAGMAEDAIEAMYQFDWDVLMRQQRTFIYHNQLIDEFEVNEEEAIERTALELEISEKIVHEEWMFSDWKEEVQEEALYRALQELNESDMELITLYAIEGFSLTEIAKKYHVTEQAISKRMIRIKNFLKNSREGL